MVPRYVNPLTKLLAVYPSAVLRRCSSRFVGPAGRVRVLTRPRGQEGPLDMLSSEELIFLDERCACVCDITFGVDHGRRPDGVRAAPSSTSERVAPSSVL
jgi:hypothetical protein